MEDISPKLLEDIIEEFEKNIDKNTTIKNILKQIDDKTATYIQAQDYAFEVGQALANAFQNSLSSNILPNGRLYYNIAEKIITPTFENNYNLITNITTNIQTNLNNAAGIGIKAQTTPFDVDRVENIINKVSNSLIYDNASNNLFNSTLSFSQSVADETLKENINFQGKAGMRPKIVRRAESNCCKWCKNLDGIYEYPSLPADVYKRHDNCRCTVDYRSGKKTQNIHSGTEGKRKYVKDEYGNYQLTKEARIAKSKELSLTENERKAAAREKRIKTWENKKAETAQNVLPEYLRNATPRQGKIIIPSDYNISKHSNEIRAANWINKTFGGDITLLSESTELFKKTTDYSWREKMWELKNTTTEESADSALRSAISQIGINSGGVILDYSNNNISLSKLNKIIDSRLTRSLKSDLDVMVVSNENVLEILRYKK